MDLCIHVRLTWPPRQQHAAAAAVAAALLAAAATNFKAGRPVQRTSEGLQPLMFT